MKDEFSRGWRHPAFKNLLFICLLTTFAISAKARTTSPTSHVSLADVMILVDSKEPSYIQYGAKDLATYLTEISGKKVTVQSSADAAKNAHSAIVIGQKMALSVGAALASSGELGDQGAVIRSYEKAGTTIVVVAGLNPNGTNWGIATLSQMIRAEGKSVYLEGPLDLKSKPSMAVRGIHLNGWPLNYPYAFRSWKEADWKRFVDIAWTQRVNLLYLWPFMEIIPVPLSVDDRAYLEEVQRVVDYAKNKRGMEVWIMQSANRIATSDCGIRDPRFRTYWVNNCQKDMNPADPAQFEKILKSFDAFYSLVNNADGFCMIDSDPGGWPQSPLSDQVKIFKAARKLLDQYSLSGSRTKLVNWMWLGWGRHKFFTSEDAVVAAYDWTEKNPDEDDVAFMEKTIRNFKQNLAEPWELISGMPKYLEAAKSETVLNKTVYLPYGAIESEPAFPLTNLGLETVSKVFEKAAEYPELRGVMGNNQLMLLQFPRTYYFYATAWNSAYRTRKEGDMLRDLADQLYPDNKDLIAEAFLELRGKEPKAISATLDRVNKLISDGDAGHAGALGRYLFPDHLSVVRNLKLQLEIRLARQALLKGVRNKSGVQEASKLVEDYFDKLLGWNKETGWDKMIDITIWTAPIYESDKEFVEAMSGLKKIIGKDAPYTSYAQIDTFFDGISRTLLKKYGQSSVMIGCVEPMKLTIIQGQ